MQGDNPTFYRDFAFNKTLDHGTGPSITFTRTGTATFFDASGTLTTATTNEPRFDHNPSTGASLGLLIEESRTNSMIRSAEFDDAAWNKANTTITANSATAPDGTTTADTLNSSNGTAIMAINNTPQVSYAAGTYTWSWFVKTNGWQWVQLRSSAALSSAYANFDIVNGVVGTASGATASLVNVGSGWFRISVTFAAAAATGDWALNLVTATNSARNSSTTGNGTSGIYIWGAQLEQGAFPTSYIPTTNAAVARGADVAVVTPISSFVTQTGDESLFAEFSAYTYGATGAFPRIVQLDQGSTTTNRYGPHLVQSSSTVFVSYFSNNVSQFSGNTSPTYSLNSTAKTASGIASNNARHAFSGTLIGADDTSITLRTSQNTHLQLGRDGGGGSSLNGHIRKVGYWPKRLPNARLQAITA